MRDEMIAMPDAPRISWVAEILQLAALGLFLAGIYAIAAGLNPPPLPV